MLLTFLGALEMSAQTKVAYCERVFSPYYELRLKYDNQYDSQNEDMFILPVTGGRLNYAMSVYGYVFIIDSSFADYRPTSTSHWFQSMGAYIGEDNEFSIANLENLNTSAVTDMSYMFYHSTYFNGKTLDLSHFDTSNVTNMSYMFAGFTKIEDEKYDFGDENSYSYRKGTLDISGFTIKSSTNTNYMFKDANISCLKVPASANELAANACEGVGSAENPCILVCPSGITPSGITQYSGYFKWKGGFFKYANTKEAYYIVNSCYVNEEGYSYLDHVEAFFYYDSQRDSRVRYDISGNANPTSYLVPQNGGKLQIPSPGLDINDIYIKFDSSFADYRPTNTSYWFSDLSTGMLTFKGMEYLNTSEVTDMSHMFQGIQTISYEPILDLSHFDTGKVTDMSYMLAGIKTRFDEGELTDFDLSSFTFKSTTNTTKMLENSTIGTLTLSVSANNLASDAFSGVGSSSAPCTLVIGIEPEGATQYNGYFKWKEGYFLGEIPKSEAYAVLTDDMKTLTFYYDIFKEIRRGITYDLNTGSNTPGWNRNGTSVESVVFDPSFADARPTSCHEWFLSMSRLSSITGIENLKTDKVTNMELMFADCSSLKNIDVSHFNTSKVTEINGMFNNCGLLESIDVSHFDTSNMTDLYGMFSNCSSLTSLDLSSFTITSTSTNTSFLLRNCSSLQSLTIPATANNIEAADVCTGVGTEASPCTLIYPDGMELTNREDFEGYFKWKGGYFKEAIKEAYAVLTTDTLTFYYDWKRSDRAGTTYDLNTASTIHGWYDSRSSVKTVVFDPSFVDARPTSCYGWFFGMSNLTTITDIKYLKTDDVTSMCAMFDGCSGLDGLDVSGFNTEKVTNMGSMFYDCFGLTSLDLSGFSTSNVNDMRYMFYGCSGLTSLDVSGFNTTNVTDMSSMFSGCSGLTSLDLSSFTITQSTNASYLLRNCSSLQTLIIPATANYIEAANACKGVGTTASPCTLVYPEGMELINREDFEGYFKWKSGYFKEAEPEPYVVLDGSTLTFYYDKNRSNYTTTYDLNTESNNPGWYGNVSNVTGVVFDSSFANARPKSCYQWFANMNNLTTISGIEYLKTDEVLTMRGMFGGCVSLTSLDVSGFNTANVTDMYYMFAGCSSLKSLDVSGFSTTQVTDMNGMFYGCSNLTSLDVSGFNTTNVTVMPGMFGDCSALTSLDLNSFTFNSSTETSFLLYGCSHLKTLVIPATANHLSSGDCTGVGTKNAPCALIYPEGFTLNPSETGEGWFKWKGGYFKEAIKEAYAVLTTDTLTFYYDWKRSDRAGTTFDLNEGNNSPRWYDNHNSVTSVVFDPSFADARPTSCYDWFSDMINLTTITGIENLKTDEVTNMRCMFYFCSSLANLDVSGFNTEKVTNMSFMFDDCSSLTSLDVSGFDTKNVTNMSGMFSCCSILTGLDVSGFNTEKVTNMDDMFWCCYGLTSLDLSSFTFKSTTSTENFLRSCTNLQVLTIPATANYLNSNNCYNVGTQDAPCTLIYPDEFELNPTATGEGWFKWKGGYFKEAPKEAYAVLSTDNKTLTFYYDKNRSNYTTTYDLNTGSVRPGWYENHTSVTTVVFDASFADARPTSCYSWFYQMSNLITITGIESLKTDEVTNMDHMFNGCSGLDSLDVSGFNTENVTTMYSMFNTCRGLKSLDVSGFDTSNVTNMGYMFSSCRGLKSLDVSGFNTSNVTSMSYMFNTCRGLKSLDVSGFSTSNVTNMSYMFAGCSGLKSLDVSEFDTSKVNNMTNMFNSCSDLTNLDVSGFDTEKLTYMGYMFAGCSGLTSLDLSHFDTSKVTTMGFMFYGCSGLTNLDLSNFNFASASTSYILYNCTSLQTLIIPTTANNLNANACTRVGTENAPCTLIYPSDFTPDVTSTGDGWYIWKSGYFKDAGLPGDANEDGHVTVADVMLTVNKVLGKTLTTFNERNADVNSDSKITVSDVMGIVKIVLSGGGNSSAPSNAFFSFTDGMALTAKGSELTLHLTGTGTYTATQMTLTLPEGCRLENAQMVASRSNGHSVLTSDLGNGHYRVVIYSASGLPFGNSCSDLVRLNVKGHHNGDVAVSDIQVVDPLTDTVLLSDVSGIATGIDGLSTDASSDGDWYTTQGQRVSTPTRGVYIRNGQKVVVR